MLRLSKKQLAGQIARHKQEINAVINLTGGQFFFVRIPKTGSASMNRAIYQVMPFAPPPFPGTGPGGTRRDNEYFEVPEDLPWWDHWSSDFLISTVGDERWKNMFTFSVVRNPWARMYSTWKYCRKIAEKDPGVGMDDFLEPFEAWVLNGCIHPWRKLHHKTVFPAEPLTSQWSWVGVPETDKMLVDLVFRLEAIDTAGVSIMRSFFGPNFEMCGGVKINQVAEPMEYTKAYTSEMVDVVHALCLEDVKKFNYFFDGHGNEHCFARPDVWEGADEKNRVFI